MKTSKRMRGQAKVHKVMGEFKRGTLRSSSGAKVTEQDQAVVIALSEAGLSRKQRGRRRHNPSPPHGRNGVFAGRGRIGVG